MSKKDLPEPETDDLTATLRGRYSRTSRTSATRETQAAARPERVRRSWYMTADTAAALESALEDLHFETRRPKHEVLGVLVSVGLENLETARARLTEEQHA